MAGTSNRGVVDNGWTSGLGFAIRNPVGLKSLKRRDSTLRIKLALDDGRRSAGQSIRGELLGGRSELRQKRDRESQYQNASFSR